MNQWFVAGLGHLDAFLTGMFFLTPDPVVNFFIGSFLLAMGCVLVGEMTLLLGIRWNRKHVATLNREIQHREAQSIQAYEMGDRHGYQALNKAANDAWGKHFFMMAALSAGALWPVPFALAWMQIYFGKVQFLIAFPLSLMVGPTVGFAFSFIPIYILCRILFGRMRGRLLHAVERARAMIGGRPRAHEMPVPFHIGMAKETGKMAKPGALPR